MQYKNTIWWQKICKKQKQENDGNILAAKPLKGRDVNWLHFAMEV